VQVLVSTQRSFWIFLWKKLKIVYNRDRKGMSGMEFDRFIKLIGKENFETIQKMTVMIVGVGGVGGYVVESLTRCGVGKLILMDPDKVDETNINRQIIATSSTVGELKVDAFKKRIQDISKDCECIPIAERLDEETIHLLDDYQPDFIVDACDDITAKKILIQYVQKNRISFIASMGTGKRLDPSQLEITTLDKTSYDPLAKILRKYTRDEHIKEKITVLASKEQPKQSFGTEIASCSFVPSVAGFLIASHIIRSVLK